jgi:hypothetical protein
MDSNRYTNLLLTLLIILSVLIFTRTIIFVLFDKHLFALDKNLGFDIQPVIQNFILPIYALLRIIIIFIFFSIKPVRVDVISIVLIYILIMSFIRFYFVYLCVYYPKSKQIEPIDRVQDINTSVQFVASTYIVYYIFFK